MGNELKKAGSSDRKSRTDRNHNDSAANGYPGAASRAGRRGFADPFPEPFANPFPDPFAQSNDSASSGGMRTNSAAPHIHRQSNNLHRPSAAAAPPPQPPPHPPQAQAHPTPAFGAPPTDPSVIARLPVAVIDSTELANHETCSVCLDEFKLKESGVIRLPCAHLFHKKCATDWLNKHCSCPNCRFELKSSQPEYEKQKAEQKRVLEQQQQNFPQHFATPAAVANANHNSDRKDHKSASASSAPVPSTVITIAHIKETLLAKNVVWSGVNGRDGLIALYLESLSGQEMRRLLTDRGMSVTGLLERSEFAAKVRSLIQL